MGYVFLLCVRKISLDLPTQNSFQMNKGLHTKIISIANSQFIFFKSKCFLFLKSKYNYFNKVRFKKKKKLRKKCHAETTGLICLLSAASILTVNKPFIFEDTKHLGSKH